MKKTIRSRRVRRAGALAAVWAVGAGAACDSLDPLLEVEAPSRVLARTLDDPANAALLVNGAVADFECALTNYVVGAGLLGDELADAQLWAAYWDFDRRTISPDGGAYGTLNCNQTSGGIYVPLATARFQADDVLGKLQGWTDAEVTNRSALLATAATYSGYSHVLLAEGMCTAAIDLGPELGRDAVNQLAVQKFDIALQAAQAAGRTDILNMARVGKGRALLNLERYADAATAVADVPEGFVINATYSGVSERRNNKVSTRVVRDGSLVIEDDFHGVAFAGVADPRVPVTDLGVAAGDRVTRWWTTSKYPSLDTPIPIATWEEAVLIRAEAAARSGDVGTAVSLINALHARVGLPDYDPAVHGPLLDQIVYERAAELFLEGHHLGDVYRFDLTQTPAPGTPYPPKAGGIYGPETKCFPLPANERLNNPSI